MGGKLSQGRSIKYDAHKICFNYFMGIGKLEYQMVYIFLFLLTAIYVWYRNISFQEIWIQDTVYYENTIATKSVIYVMVITYDLLPIVDRKLKDQQQLYDFTIYDLETLRYR